MTTNISDTSQLWHIIETKHIIEINQKHKDRMSFVPPPSIDTLIKTTRQKIAF